MHYRYSPKVFDRAPEIACDTIYVVGGLYGNVEALQRVLAMAHAESGPVTLVFNGDFHWFDVDAADFERISLGVLEHHAIRGNVETELACEESGAGCGCAYPMDVSDAEVSRSNEMLARLRETARSLPEWREKLGALPMHLVAQIGDARVGVVHGDAASLAGWGFAHDRLDDPSHARWLDAAFRDARVDVFASTHTCVPALRAFDRGVVCNNGAAGMPNHAGTRFGLLTRISTRAYRGFDRMHGVERSGVHVDALRIDYDHESWLRRFLASWPESSPAHTSYHRRIVEGPRFS
ncbi:MAG TPA: metallophosphoesterase [Usitatibacter sp.]|nr:metallophosphoesterase [Usitatibacter sp.]